LSSARILRRSIVVALTLAVAPAGLAATAAVRHAEKTTSASYYVDSASGDDNNPGTARAPWRTLARASRAVLMPGDRLLLRRGRTWTGPLYVSGSGTSSAPIIVATYGPGRLPVVEQGSSCIVISGSHVIVRTVQAVGCAWAGVRITGKADMVERSVMRGNAAGVDVARQAVAARVLGNQLIGNNRMSVLTAEPKNDDSGAFGVLIRGDQAEVAFNTIVGSDAFSYDFGRDGAAVEIYGGRGSRIHHNLAIDNNAFTELGLPQSSDTLYAYNVVRSSLRTSTFLVTRGAGSALGPVLGTRASNNSVMLTGQASQGFVCAPGCSRAVLRLRNNIIGAFGRVGYVKGSVAENNDLFFGGALQFSKGPASNVALPKFVDPARGDLRLRSSSPAIDAGTKAPYAFDFDSRHVPIDGDGDGKPVRDLGAFEFVPKKKP
jgi:hypothetical protein